LGTELGAELSTSVILFQHLLTTLYIPTLKDLSQVTPLYKANKAMYTNDLWSYLFSERTIQGAVHS